MSVSHSLCKVQVSWLEERHERLESHSKIRQKAEQKGKEMFKPAAGTSLNLEKLRNIVPYTLKQNFMTLKTQPASVIRSFCSAWVQV